MGEGGATAATRQEGRAGRENIFPFNHTFVGGAEHKLESRITPNPKVEGGGETSTGNAVDRLAGCSARETTCCAQAIHPPTFADFDKIDKIQQQSNCGHKLLFF